MPDGYTTLVAALKAITQGEAPNTVTLPMAENEWNTRPEAESYGIVTLDYETGVLNGDNLKCDTSYEGAVDLFSHSKSGNGWVELIRNVLEAQLGACWSLNSHMYERETGLFHWEWTFEVI